LKQPDGARVLLTPEDELLLFFALRHLFPDGHRHGHHHGHDAHRNEQHGHGVAGIPGVPAPAPISVLTA